MWGANWKRKHKGRGSFRGAWVITWDKVHLPRKGTWWGFWNGMRNLGDVRAGQFTGIFPFHPVKILNDSLARECLDAWPWFLFSPIECGCKGEVVRVGRHDAITETPIKKVRMDKGPYNLSETANHWQRRKETPRTKAAWESLPGGPAHSLACLLALETLLRVIRRLMWVKRVSPLEIVVWAQGS